MEEDIKWAEKAIYGVIAYGSYSHIFNDKEVKAIENLIARNKELERQIKIKNAYLGLIWNIGYDYDGCETPKSLKGLIDELLEMVIQARDNDDKSVMYEDFSGKHKKNILQEPLEEGE